MRTLAAEKLARERGCGDKWVARGDGDVRSEFLAHAREIRAEREAAAKRGPCSLDLIRSA